MDDTETIVLWKARRACPHATLPDGQACERPTLLLPVRRMHEARPRPHAQQREHERAHEIAGHVLEHESRRWLTSKPAFAAPLTNEPALPELPGPQVRICLRCRKRVRAATIAELAVAKAAHARACHGGWIASERQKWTAL